MWTCSLVDTVFLICDCDISEYRLTHRSEKNLERDYFTRYVQGDLFDILSEEDVAALFAAADARAKEKLPDYGYRG